MSGIDGWTNDIHECDAGRTLAENPESSVHMAMTSPPYFGLRDYGIKGQIGLEGSLNEYIDTLVDVGKELRRVLRNDGSWWLNLGDSFAGSWGAQSKDDDANNRDRDAYPAKNPGRNGSIRRKSKMLVPHRVTIALQGAGWVVRADCPWVKPNPMPHPVKDRLHEHKEFVFHLTPEPDYWFDLDAVREPHKEESVRRAGNSYENSGTTADAYPDRESSEYIGTEPEDVLHPNGKNPGDVLEITVKSFPEAHFAVYPPELCETPIKSSCPPTVCAACGTPYERDCEVVDREVGGGSPAIPGDETGYSDESGNHQGDYGDRDGFTQPIEREISPWEQACDCDTDATEPGIVLDPFAGAGTTCMVAKNLGRRFIGIDLNPDYVALAQRRVGVTVDEPDRLLDDSEQAMLPLVNGGDNW
jgi:DNA modification methylase